MPATTLAHEWVGRITRFGRGKPLSGSPGAPAAAPMRHSAGWALGSRGALCLAVRELADGDRETCPGAFAGRERAQARAAAKRVRRRGHRLEADAFGVARGKHLRARVAVGEVDLDAAAGAGDGEATGLGHLVE